MVVPDTGIVERSTVSAAVAIVVCLPADGDKVLVVIESDKSGRSCGQVRDAECCNSTPTVVQETGLAATVVRPIAPQPMTPVVRRRR